MPDGFLFGGMIAANAREIDKSGDGSQKGGDNAPNDTIECARVETLHRDEITHDIEHEAEREESDGRMHQKRMKRVAERFSFKQLFDHNHTSLPAHSPRHSPLRRATSSSTPERRRCHDRRPSDRRDKPIRSTTMSRQSKISAGWFRPLNRSESWAGVFWRRPRRGRLRSGSIPCEAGRSSAPVFPS